MTVAVALLATATVAVLVALPTQSSLWLSLGSVLAGHRRHTAPCTAAAVVELLASDSRLSPEGRHVVVVGRSLVVGRPLAAMLAAPLPGGQATVTVCHTRTPDLGGEGSTAEVTAAVIAAL